MTEEQLTDSTDALEADATISEEQRLAKVPAELRAASWKPGQSGNPSGRPSKLKTLTGMLESKVNREEIATKLIAIANDPLVPVSTRLEAIKYIYARIEGNPIQAMRHQIDGQVGALIFLPPGKDAPETNTAESEAIDITAEEPTQTGMSDTSSDPAGPPSV